MFKDGIKPQWEDEANAKGSEFRIEIKLFNNNDSVQQIWHKIVSDLVLGHAPHIKDGIAGVRINMRQKSFQFVNYRLEVWMMIEDEKDKIIQDIKKYLEENILNDILRDQHGAYLKFEDRKQHKEEMAAKKAKQ